MFGIRATHAVYFPLAAVSSEPLRVRLADLFDVRNNTPVY